MAFRNYREAIEWLVGECALVPVNELAKDKAVRLVAALAQKVPTAIAGEVWRRLDRRARVLASVRTAASDAGGAARIKRIATLAGCDWLAARREIKSLEAAGAVNVGRRRSSREFMVTPREPGHG